MKDRLKAAMKDAMKAKDKVRLQTIRSILSAIQYEEMQKKVDDLGEAEIVALLKTEIKKRNESLDFAKQNGREDLQADLTTELTVIEGFLPEQMTAEQLEQFIVSLKDENPEINLGFVMKTLKEKHSGQYDGKLASEVARKVLG